MTGAQVSKLAFAEAAFEDPVQRSDIRLPWRRAPVQIVIDIKRRPFHRRRDTEEIDEVVRFIAVKLAFQRGTYAARRIYPDAIGSESAKAGIHQAITEGERIALDIEVTVDSSIFLPPQPALFTAQL